MQNKIILFQELINIISNENSHHEPKSKVGTSKHTDREQIESLEIDLNTISQDKVKCYRQAKVLTKCGNREEAAEWMEGLGNI